MNAPTTAAAPSRRAKACAALLCIVAWYLTLAPVSVGGPLSMVLVSGDSMEPTYHPGDLVLAWRDARPSAGEVAVFEHPEGPLVIHRIRQVSADRLVTRGDNVPTDDPWPTQVTDVHGTARLVIPAAGTVLVALGQPAIMGGLAAVALFCLIMMWNVDADEDRRRSRRLRGRLRRARRPRAPHVRRPTSGPAMALSAVAFASSFVGGHAASLTVTADDLMVAEYAAPFQTVLLTPGNGGGPGGGGPGGGGNGGGPGGGPGNGGGGGGGGGRP